MPIKIKENNEWIPVTDDAVWGKIEGEIINQADLKKELDKKATVTALNSGLNDKQPKGDYATNTALIEGLKGKQDKGDYQPAGNYATKEELTNGLAGKQDNGPYVTTEQLTQGLNDKQDKGDYALKSDLTPLATKQEVTNGLSGKQPNGDYALNSAVMHKTGNVEESVDGRKTFTSNFLDTCNGAIEFRKDNEGGNIKVNGSHSNSFELDGHESDFRVITDSNKSVQVPFRITNGVCECNTTPGGSNGTEIVTADYLNSITSKLDERLKAIENLSNARGSEY